MNVFRCARVSRLLAVCSILGNLILLLVVAAVDLIRANVRQLTAQGYFS